MAVEDEEQAWPKRPVLLRISGNNHDCDRKERRNKGIRIRGSVGRRKLARLCYI